MSVSRRSIPHSHTHTQANTHVHLHTHTHVARTYNKDGHDCVAEMKHFHRHTQTLLTYSGTRTRTSTTHTHIHNTHAHPQHTRTSTTHTHIHNTHALPQHTRTSTTHTHFHTTHAHPQHTRTSIAHTHIHSTHAHPQHTRTSTTHTKEEHECATKIKHDSQTCTHMPTNTRILPHTHIERTRKRDMSLSRSSSKMFSRLFWLHSSGVPCFNIRHDCCCPVSIVCASERVALCCSVLQSVAVRCRVCAVYSTSHTTVVVLSTMCVGERVLQCAAACCRVSQ